MTIAERSPTPEERGEATLPYHEHTKVHCCYVIGEPEALTLCGHYKRENSVYCAYHHALCYRPTPPNRNVVPMRRERAP